MASAGRQIYKLYVSNLPWTVGSQELKAYFAKYGQVNAATVIFDKNTGLSKNYGFVQFTTKEAFESVSNSGQHILEGNVLKIDLAN